MNNSTAMAQISFPAAASKPETRTLKVWSGRGTQLRTGRDPRWMAYARVNHAPTAYICAYSLADARSLIKLYTGFDVSVYEISNYWSDHWGSDMDGIEKERGLWLHFDKKEQPVKVV